MGKQSTCNEGDAGDLGSIPGLERSPGGGHGNPLQYPCLENPHEQRILVGYSPWGCRVDTTERLSIAQTFICIFSATSIIFQNKNFLIIKIPHMSFTLIKHLCLHMVNNT